MADEISINFVANVREVIEGTDKMSDALGGTERDLDNVGDKGEKSLDKVVKGTNDAKDGAGGLAGTVSGELANSFESFDGSASGALEGVTSGLSSLAGLIPGVGGLIGAGLGAVASQWAASWSAASEENKQTVSDMYDDMVESGNTYLSQQYLINEVTKLLGEEEGNKFDEIKAKAEKLTLPIETVAAAYAGWGDAISEVRARAEKLIDSETQRQGKANYATDLIVASREAITEMDRVAASTDTAAIRAEAAINTTNRYKDSWAGVEGAAARADTAVTRIPASKKVVIDVDASQIEKAVQSRTVRVDIETYTRNGTRVY